MLTPTYHVFEMFKVHQGATVVPVEVRTPDYVLGGEKIPAVGASASRDAAGKVHLSLVNTDPNHPATVAVEVRGTIGSVVTGRVLTAPAMNTCNTFAAPRAVEPQPFTGAKLVAGKLEVALPAKSFVVLEL